MSNWNASNYRDRAAKRQAERMAAERPSWIINPETGEQFYLRRVSGLMSSVLAGYMPHSLTQTAVEAWKEQGIEGMPDTASIAEIAAKMTPEQREAGERETRTVARIIQQACVIPFLSNDPPSAVEFSDEWKKAAIAGLKEKDPHFDESKFDPKELVFDPQDLDESDTNFLIRWAKGLGPVSVKGGNVTGIQDVERFRKKLARGSRARTDKSQIRETA